MSNLSKKEIVELIGAAGIVASLVFVGIEINQSTSLARLEAQRAYSTSIAEYLSEWAAPDRATVIAKLVADSSPEELSEIERIQAIAYFSGELNLIYGLYESVNEGLLSEDNLAFIEKGNRLYSTQFFMTIWPALKLNFDEEFARYFESLSWNAG